MKIRFVAMALTCLAPALAAGPQNYKLNGPLPSGPPAGNVSGAWFSPDGTRVVYVATGTSAVHDDLYSVPSDGSAPAVRLNGPTTTDAVFGAIDPSGARVLFLSSNHLYGVPIDGSSAATRLDGALGLRLTGTDIEISAAGARVLFRGSHAANRSPDRLFSVPLDGSAAALEISGTIVAGGDGVTSFTLTPDGTHAIFLASANTSGVYELYRVATDGSAPRQKLSGTMVSGGSLFLDWTNQTSTSRTRTSTASSSSTPSRPPAAFHRRV